MNWKLKLFRLITNYSKLIKIAVMATLLVIAVANGGVAPTGERDPEDYCAL